MKRGICRLLLLAILALAAVFAAAEEEKAAFYRPPQLWVMTGFIANTTSGTWGTDFVGSGEWNPQKQVAALAAWNKGLGKDYDPDTELLRFKQSGATGIIFYDKWHDGLVPHDTKITGYKTERDLVGATVRAARKLGLKTVIYYSVGLDSNPEPKFRDWVCLDAQGRPMGRAFPTDWLSFHSPYRQYVIDHLVEILKMHGPFDGFWLDLYIQPVPTYDRYSKAAFQKRYGKTMENGTRAEHIDFEIETRREFLLDIRKAVTAIQPNIGFTYNSSGRADMVQPKLIDRVDKLVDWFSMEGHTWTGIDHGATGGHNADRPGEVGILLSSSWYVPMEDTAPPPAMTPDEAVTSSAWALVRGANVYAAMTPGHSGKFDQTSDVKLLGAVGSWLGQQKPWLEGALPYADIGILRGVNAPNLRQVPSPTEFWPMAYQRSASRGGRFDENLDQAFRGIGYFSELLGTAFPMRKEDWKQHRLLVIGENSVFDEALAQRVREYVRAGGRVLAFANASRLGSDGALRANFALNDVFGVNLAGELPGYKRLKLLPGSGLSAQLRVNPGALKVTPTTARVLAQWQSAGDAPAILENRFGNGSVIYVTADQVSCLQSRALLEELAGRLIGAPVVKVQGNRQYALLMNRRGDDLLLYLFNRSTGSRAYTESGMVPESMDLLPPEPVQVSIDTRVLSGIAGLELLPGGKPAKFSARDGELRAWIDASGSVTALRLVRGKP